MNIRAVAMTCVLLTSVGLSGCANTAPSGDESSTTSTSQSPSATPSAKPMVDPALVADGNAQANLKYFTWVIEKTLAADSAADSFAIAQAIASAGFDPTTVQFTFTRTAVGLAADTSDVAAQFAGECLIGQFGPAAPQVITRVMPVLASGGCLIGTEVQSLG